MNQRVLELYRLFTHKEHASCRKSFDQDLAHEFAVAQMPPITRVTERLLRLLAAETPLIFPGERLVLTRTISNLPPLFTPAEWDDIRNHHFLHEAGVVCNICPHYETVIASGLDAVLREAQERRSETNDAEQTAFYRSVIRSIQGVYDLCDRYRKAASVLGNTEVADILSRIPRQGAKTFHEALQFFRILHFTLWLEGEYHNTVGRFDQFMYPYFRADLDCSRLDRDSAFELLEEFFLSFNKDSDLYTGVQQGDNGQSLVLGGVDEQGHSCFNQLSELCLLASKELKLIDPKINLRTDKETPLEIYHVGTELTKAGLGFPQYENDDVVIPALLAKGYSLEDARNYVVAACWEFIVPGCGMDIPNIGALSFPSVVEKCVNMRLDDHFCFDDLMCAIEAEIEKECDGIIAGMKNLWMVPAPFMSVLMDGCVECGRDISLGAKYNNYGLHGTGLSTAADSLAAVRKYVFEEKSISAQTMMDALNKNFEGYDELYHLLRYEAPKMGNNDDFVDSIAVGLLEGFAKALDRKKNERGGCFRAGTGSAMFYLWHASEVGASADGRKKGDSFGANYSPSLHAHIDGPLSVIQSFTKPDLAKTCNGGPLTMELHSSVFSERSGIEKVARLVKRFIALGGHQLQLNAINRDTLLEAQRHPEDFSNLIVRIWGWSAYFVELDKAYQDHVIARQEYVS